MSEGRDGGASSDDLEDAPEPVLDGPARAIAARLAALSDVPPPSGWQAAVLAALPEDPPPPPPVRGEAPRAQDSAAALGAQVAAEPRPDADRKSGLSLPRRSRARRWAMGGAAASAAAMATALALWRSRPAPIELGKPELLVRHSGGVRAAPVSGRAALGDLLRVEVTAPQGAVLRLYRNDREVVLECPSAAPQCEQRARGLAAELLLTRPGSYRAVVLRSAAGVPRSVGDLNSDLDACDGETSMSQPLVVQ